MREQHLNSERLPMAARIVQGTTQVMIHPIRGHAALEEERDHVRVAVDGGPAQHTRPRLVDVPAGKVDEARHQRVVRPDGIHQRSPAPAVSDVDVGAVLEEQLHLRGRRGDGREPQAPGAISGDHTSA